MTPRVALPEREFFVKGFLGDFFVYGLRERILGPFLTVVLRLCCDYGSSTDAERVGRGYDRAGNRLWRETPVAAVAGKKLDEFYTYDGVYQLANLDRGDLNPGKTAITGTPDWEEDFDIDPTGN